MKKSTDTEIKKILNNILTCLYIVIALVGLTLIIVISGFQNDSIDASSAATSVAEEEIVYDVTGFDEMTTTQILDAIDTPEFKVIYVGSEGCGYCRLFLAPMMEAQTKYNFRHIYLDINDMSSNDIETFKALSSDISDSFGYTPMIVITKNNLIIKVNTGYMEEDAYISFLNEAGIN